MRFYRNDQTSRGCRIPPQNGMAGFIRRIVPCIHQSQLCDVLRWYCRPSGFRGAKCLKPGLFQVQPRCCRHPSLHKQGPEIEG